MANDPGSNKYNGVVRSNTGAPLEGVDVKIRYTNSSGQSILQPTKTAKDGTWNASLPNGIDPSQVTITFVKKGYSSFTIKNPKISDTFQFPPPAVDKYRGGTLNFAGGFDAGKYLISSLSSYDQSLLDYNLASALEFVNFYEKQKKPGQTENYAQIKIVASESTLSNTDLEPSSSNGAANPDYEKPLPSKSLSDKRADNLIKYIKKYFTDNGTPAPNVRKDIKIGEPDPKTYKKPNPFPKRGTPEYDKAIQPYLPYQYVRVQALLTGPPCAEIPFDGSQFGSLGFTKPPGTKKIELYALNFADRFGFSLTEGSTGATFDSVFHQDETGGSLLSWGFMAYLKLGRIPNPPFPGQDSVTISNKPYRKIVTGKEVYNSLLADWFVQKDGTIDPNNPGLIGREIYNWNKIRYESSGKAYQVPPKDAKANIDFMFEDSRLSRLGTIIDAEGTQTNQFYSYTIIRGPRTYDISDIPDFGTFYIHYQAGNLIEPSVFRYKLCPN
jgi:hypothetical protein